MKIRKMWVTVRPYEYTTPSGWELVKLDMRVEVEGREIVTTKIVHADDLESRFDFMFDKCRDALKAEIKRRRNYEKIR